ncbi:glycosyltransferase [Nonomuraea sp. NPDC050310]|uniref:glycosyltransferase family 2 protein n=1 Tax=Nonomuraea sp. NPDC050310 TaxID=3154935 RepID=UPI0033E97C59
MAETPDVTVIVAVYNTMPYLTDCLTSLAGQSIGLERLQVVAVDDGSTDGSGKELDRFADLYPGVFSVIHQDNSGGPAAPSNRGLEAARGRYVFFLGADDHLGAEALERMVACADEHGSDVVLGRTEGVNGRHILQDVYERTEPDLSLYDSALPYSLSNTKLFRRSLITEHGLRFPEDMPVASDQPFTIEACVRARRISVLADYTYYYAVRRADDSNITYRTGPLARLRSAEQLITFTAGLLPPGPRRDAVLERHFAWELAKLLRVEFLDFEPDEQDAICERVDELSCRYLTDRIRAGLTRTQRYRLALAARRDVAALCRSLRRPGTEPLVLEGDEVFERLPGYGSLDPECFAFQGAVAKRVARGMRLELSPARGGFTMRVTVPLLGACARVPADLALLGAPAEVSRALAADGSGTVLTARLSARRLVRQLGRRRLTLSFCAGGERYEISLPAPAAPQRTWAWHRFGPRRALLQSGKHDNLLLVVSKISLRPLRRRQP